MYVFHSCFFPPPHRTFVGRESKCMETVAWGREIEVVGSLPVGRVPRALKLAAATHRHYTVLRKA